MQQNIAYIINPINAIIKMGIMIKGMMKNRINIPKSINRILNISRPHPHPQPNPQPLKQQQTAIMISIKISMPNCKSPHIKSFLLSNDLNGTITI